MKRTKKLYILLGVLVVICIATFALSIALMQILSNIFILVSSS